MFQFKIITISNIFTYHRKRGIGNVSEVFKDFKVILFNHLEKEWVSHETPEKVYRLNTEKILRLIKRR